MATFPPLSPPPGSRDRVVLHPAQFRAGFVPPLSPPAGQRLFAYYWTVCWPDGRLRHRSVDYTVVDRWNGSAEAAHRELAADLEVIVPADQQVSIFGGYV